MWTIFMDKSEQYGHNLKKLDWTTCMKKMYITQKMTKLKEMDKVEQWTTWTKWDKK